MKKCPCGNDVAKSQKICLKCHAKYMRNWRKSHPLTKEQRKKMICRSYLKVYVKRGKINKQPCEICGNTIVEAHHEDYSKPLMVRWLCRPHHVDVTFKRLLLKCET